MQYRTDMNDALATWLDTATYTELVAAGNRAMKAKRASRAIEKLMTVIGLACMARNARLDGRIDRARYLERRREDYLEANY